VEEKVAHNDDLDQVENPEESLAEQALGGGMHDVAHISHSMANAYNETIQKADASLLAISSVQKS
jgi:hypothetical protein